MAKPELEFFDPSGIPSEPIPPVEGLSQQILSRDDVSGDYTRLLRFEPGTDTSPMGPQVHDFWEEVWIIEGSIHDIPPGQDVHRRHVRVQAARHAPRPLDIA